MNTREGEGWREANKHQQQPPNRHLILLPAVAAGDACGTQLLLSVAYPWPLNLAVLWSVSWQTVRWPLARIVKNIIKKKKKPTQSSSICLFIFCRHSSVFRDLFGQQLTTLDVLIFSGCCVVKLPKHFKWKTSSQQLESESESESESETLDKTLWHCVEPSSVHVCLCVCVCVFYYTLDGVSLHTLVFGYFPLIAIACPELGPLFVCLSRFVRFGLAAANNAFSCFFFFFFLPSIQINIDLEKLYLPNSSASVIRRRISHCFLCWLPRRCHSANSFILNYSSISFRFSFFVFARC